MENVSDLVLTDDQYFLLCLVMGAYFGPDLKEGGPKRSALQRRVEGLPQYQANDLAGSNMKSTITEQHSVVKQPLLLQYIYGGLTLSLKRPATYLHFDDLFPPWLHRRSQWVNNHFTINNIVFINNPTMDYINPGDIKRFRRLAGLEDFVLDRKMTLPLDDKVLYNPKVESTPKLDNVIQHHSVQLLDYVPCSETYPDDGNQPSSSSKPCSSSQCNESQFSYSPTVPVPSQMNINSGEVIDQGMIFFPSCPTREEWDNLVSTIDRGFALTGSAARGTVGPVLGLMDIGEAEDSYLFRVSLPGVRRDDMNFSCEVERDGTVVIKGVTVTGEKTVERYYQVFEMRSHNLCPPGPFSISFKLPGPVDPQHFHGTFSTDGILEGMALKARIYRS